jgi:hypothetical protein
MILVTKVEPPIIYVDEDDVYLLYIILERGN